MLTLPSSDDLPELNSQAFFYWNHAGMEMNRVTASVSGPQGGPTMASRALGLQHLAMHDAYFAVVGATRAGGAPWATYLPVVDAGVTRVPLPPLDGADDPAQALAAAAVTVLDRLFGTPGPGISIDATQTLLGHLGRVIGGSPTPLDVLSPSYRFGAAVAKAILDWLAVAPGEPGADQGRYMPKAGRFYFRDEPTHPVRLKPVDPNNPNGPQQAQRIYHGPFYGSTAKVFATQGTYTLADPPRDTPDYLDALREVVGLGGAPTLNTTTRSADQTVAGYYWAYDGSNLVGTPPRLYNQILRHVAWTQRTGPAGTPPTEAETDEFVRLFALANAAMADAGVFCWREKYHFEFWRPLSGVREHDRGGRPIDPDAHPFWLTLGAPDTNSHNANFKPPFPAYPSGHATFGAACFQIARLFYLQQRAGQPGFTSGADDQHDPLGFTMVSDELNGVSRDLDARFDPNVRLEDQPGTVRTRVVRTFPSLWEAIIENARSRIFLGVHWSFDAFAIDPATGGFKVGDRTRWPGGGGGVTAGLPIGGVPLGLMVAADVFGPNGHGLRPRLNPVLGLTAPGAAPPAQATSALPPDTRPKATNTNVR